MEDKKVPGNKLKESNRFKDAVLLEKQQRNAYIKREMISWVKYIITALIVAVFITQFVIVNAYVPTPSMVSTIMPKDRIVANRLQYMFSGPDRGDIVVFRFPDDESLLYVKRIIGLPGERIEIKDGIVYINGQLLKEPYIKEQPVGSYGPYEVPQGMYFMMGDNRNHSRDSREWNNKFVKKEKILGKVFLEYYPKLKYLGD